MADRPETKHCFPAKVRICVTASMVSSAEVAVSKKYCHHGGISGIEHAVNFIRQHLLRDGQIQNAVIPQN